MHRQAFTDRLDARIEPCQPARRRHESCGQKEKNRQKKKKKTPVKLKNKERPTAPRHQLPQVRIRGAARHRAQTNREKPSDSCNCRTCPPGKGTLLHPEGQSAAHTAPGKVGRWQTGLSRAEIARQSP